MASLPPLYSPTLSCGRCSSVIQYQWIFCEHCGQQLQSSPPQLRTRLQPAVSSSLPSSQVTSLPKLKLKNHLRKVQQNYITLSKQKARTLNAKKERANPPPAPEEKLKELEEKRYQDLEQMLQKFEKHNEKMTKYYQRMEKAFSRSSHTNPLSSSDPPSPSLYLHEQPSIIDRLKEGFTAEEDAERVLFWGGGKTKSIDDPDRATPLPKLFTSSYWGPSESSDTDGDCAIFSQDSEQIDVLGGPIHESIPSAGSHSLSKDQDDQQSDEEEIRNGNCVRLESIRRQITRHLLKLIHLLRWVLRKTDFDILIDPITLSNPLQLYAKHSLRLTVAITRAYEVQFLANGFSQQYLLSADKIRQEVAVQIAEAQHEADLAHQGCHELYQCVSSGVFLNNDCQPEFNHTTITDSVLIQRNQQRVLEYSKDLLGPVRRHINQLVAKENQMITQMRNDEMALRTAQEQYQPVIMDLILKCKTMLARVTSVKRWIAVRILQRFVREVLYR